MTQQRIKFNRQQSGFYKTLQQRVNDFFERTGRSKHANSTMVTKSVLMLTGFIATYALIVSNLFHPAIMLALAMLNGFFTAMIGLNIAHDAIHGAYSTNKKVNRVLGSLFNFVGANDYNWSISHNIVHHTFTNIPDHDGDIQQVPILRMNPKQELWKVHRFQHWYVFLFYPLTSLIWVLFKDYKVFFSKKIGSYNNSQKPRKEMLRLFGFKAFYYIMMLVVPMLVLSVAWYWILFGFLMLHLVEGFTLSIIFQLAHVIEGTEFPEPDEKGMIGNTWAEHQMYTTANFATGQFLPNYLFGGLNFQVEHHLFPKICHVHYKHIQPIVQQTAREFGLPYHNYQTVPAAVASHVRTLKKFGRMEDPELVPAH